LCISNSEFGSRRGSRGAEGAEFLVHCLFCPMAKAKGNEHAVAKEWQMFALINGFL